MRTITGVNEAVMRDAAAGRLSKDMLASMLTPEQRTQFLNACAAIDKRYTEACTAAHDPCLESGCALEGEICLQPLLRAEDDELRRAYGAEWLNVIESVH